MAKDPCSEITFYRSHLGGLGNLLEQLLVRRNPKHRKVLVQCDLSTVNLVSDPKLRAQFAIDIAGCGAHARRPFKRYQHEDPELCDLMLGLFRELSHFEKSLDLVGRNEQNVRAVRDVDARETWETIDRLATMVAHQWSGQSKLGDAARYLTRHRDALTRYLDDPRLSWTNNHSERDLRPEKMIEASSMFRATLEGRFALDILRTICQTASSVEGSLAEYLEFVLLSSEEAVEKSPETFTPYAWAQSIRDTEDDVT